MFKNKPPIFNTSGKPEISLTMLRIKEWQDQGYSLGASYYESGQIEGGHEATISGIADDYWRGGNEVVGTKLRFHIKLSSDLSRLQMDQGIIGGGQFYDEYVDVDLNLESSQLRDIVYELRVSQARQVHVGGYAISDKIFRVTKFGLSEPRDGQS
ncbi:hypothetical protein EEB18_000550 [Sphingopyxis sp. OPL5]|uniref:hypothetical protein n=1 Tax=Sphingopyxis sp. OPL5 TaxID=2486273 RepID=UPI00164DD77F|nr:hypothetical protein [Sphingopyxis sp. OPL5]QNO27529.1 hypothetical protein EEB18_000550 [Sphingopyxis sp. OPL5]